MIDAKLIDLYKRRATMGVMSRLPKPKNKSSDFSLLAILATRSVFQNAACKDCKKDWGIFFPNGIKNIYIFLDNPAFSCSFSFNFLLLKHLRSISSIQDMLLSVDEDTSLFRILSTLTTNSLIFTNFEW